MMEAGDEPIDEMRREVKALLVAAKAILDLRGKNYGPDAWLERFDHMRDVVQAIEPGYDVPPFTFAPSPWSKTPPTEEGLYWLCTKDLDVIPVLFSPSQEEVGRTGSGRVLLATYQCIGAYGCRGVWEDSGLLWGPRLSPPPGPEEQGAQAK